MTLYKINYIDRDGYPCEQVGEISDKYVIFDGRKIKWDSVKALKMLDFNK